MKPLLFSTIAIFFCFPDLTHAQDESRISDETLNAGLKQYYERRLTPSFWQDSLEQLKAESDEQKAAAHLFERLLTLSLKNELRRGTPYELSGDEYQFRQSIRFRRDLIEAGDHYVVPAALPLYRWYLQNDYVVAHVIAAVDFVCQIKTRESDQILLELVKEPHANVTVVAKAIDEIMKSKLKIPEKRLLELCVHHRIQTRQAALKACQKLRIAVTEKFDPHKTIRSKPIAKFMKELSSVIPEPPKVSQSFVVVSFPKEKTDTDPENDDRKVGWLLDEDDSGFRVLHSDGTIGKYSRTKEVFSDLHGLFLTTRKADFEKVEPAESLQWIGKQRFLHDTRYIIKRDSAANDRWKHPGAGLFDFLLAEWLFRKKEFDLCAKVLFPALDTLHSNTAAIQLLKARLGWVYGNRMFDAFAYDRDYDQTMKLAKIIDSTYPHTKFYKYAVIMIDQLPKRRDDLKSLNLPTNAEWKELMKKLSHKEQVDYLCRRIRLINICHEITLRNGEKIPKSQLKIQPYLKLESMKLNPDDILVIAPYLRENWYIVDYAFIDFNTWKYGRSLSRTRSLFPVLLDKCAKCDLIDADEIDKWSQEKVESEIVRVNKWAREHAGKSEPELLLEGIQFNFRKNRNIDYSTDLLDKLVELKVKNAVPHLVKIIDSPKSNAYDKRMLLNYCRKLDVSAVRDCAQRHLKHKKYYVQLEAAVILWLHENTEKTRTNLSNVLLNATISQYVRDQITETLKLLMNEGSTESIEVAGTIFQGKCFEKDRFATTRNRILIARMFHKKNLPDGYREYLKNIQEYGFYNSTTFAKEVLLEIDPESVELKKLYEKHKDNSEKMIEVAKGWLKKRIAETTVRN